MGNEAGFEVSERDADWVETSVNIDFLTGYVGRKTVAVELI